MNIGVYVELGGLNTMTIPDSIIEPYAALDQAESQSRSKISGLAFHSGCATVRQF